MEVKNEMSIDNELLKEFAHITNDSQTKTENTYLRGTIVSNSGSKYVQIDGSSTATPITETVDVEEGDRVLVSIEKHKATIVGNFTFPPSARKEQEALDKSESAQDTANTAQTKAQEASNKADTAIDQSSIASASADEAKQQASDAIAAANTASTNASEAKNLATQASTDASEAKTKAAESQAASANAQAEVTKLQNEVKDAQADADKALADLETQAGEITIIKETYATKVEVGNTKAELETTITTKVGELATTVSKTYSTKTENVELEQKLQTQITQNSDNIATQVTKVEKLESDTAKAQEDVTKALLDAANAQTAADNAQTAANTAQQAANTADQKAVLAKNAADAAQQAADAADQAVQSAQEDLNEAKENLANVTSRVDATEADILEAQNKVDAAQTAVNDALADAAEANLAATKAQQAADKAQEDATAAQGAANTAQQKADNAQTAADNAQSAADKAQADVAALTSRVTTAETTISQNSENITLNANKTEEIGNKIDTVETNLGNNYYTKTETDAKIEIESDRITSTVTRVETVENKAVISSVEEFYLSSSPTELVDGSWSTSQPTWTEGMYIWRRTLVTKGDGSTSYQPNQNGVCITGNPGESAPEIETIKSFDGDYILLTDSSNYELMNLKVYGKTSQYTTSGDGKNKFDISKVNYGNYFSGTTKVEPNDTGFTVYTDSHGIDVVYSDNMLDMLEPNTTYICTAKVRLLDRLSAINTNLAAYGTHLLRLGNDTIILEHEDKTNFEIGRIYECETTFTTPNDTSDYSLGCWTYRGASGATGKTIIEFTDLMIRLATEPDDTYEPFGTEVSPSLDKPSDITNIENNITINVSSDSGSQTAIFSLGSNVLMEGSYLDDDGIHHTRRKIFLPVSDMNNTESQPGWTNVTELKTDYSNINDRFSNVTNYWSNIYMSNATSFSIDTTSDKSIIYINDSTLTQSEFKTNYSDLVVEIEYELINRNGTLLEEIIPYTEEQQVAWTELQSLHTYTPESIIESTTRISGEYYTTFKGDKGDDGASENLTEMADNLNSRIDQAQSMIDQLSNMISQLITDSNGGSLMTQTPDGWTFNMSSISDNLTTIKDAMIDMENKQDDSNSALEKLSNLVNDVANKTAYITMSTDENGDPCIELGKTNNQFKVRITNTAIDFLEGSMRIAYANNNTFYTEKMIVKNELQIGETIGFVWKTRPNGNMGLSPIKA